MTFDLDAEEQRVLGTLIEKQLATPQYYPLTLSALVQGCNQATSREPVTNYDETTVRLTLQRLKDRELVRTVYPSHGRSVDRYAHRLDEQLTLIAEELAVLAMLMLRGPQTENELKTRTERLAAWSEPDTPPSILDRLATKPEPLATNVGRGHGRQDRWAHLLGPVPAESAAPAASDIRRAEQAAGAALAAPRQNDEALRALEARVSALEAEIADLKAQLGA